MRLGTYYRAQILKHFNIKAYKPFVLDVGGYDGYWLSTQKAKNKYVLDLNIRENHKSIHYIKASALNMPFRTNYFDQVFAFDVLEHIEANKEQKFLDELMRVTKKGGEIILSTPSKSIKMFPGFMTNYISHKWGHFKGNGYSKQQLNKLMAKYKNINYQISDFPAFFYLIFYFPLRLCWSILPKLIMKLVDLTATYDSKRKSGNNGFYIVKIKKHEK